MGDEAGRRAEGHGREVDPWRFAGSFIARALGAGIPAEPSHPPIPWAPLQKPLSEATVALHTTAGISMKEDAPFDMEMERRNPMRGDPSFRKIRADATSATTVANHLHIDTGYIARDLNVALPLDRLRELADEGIVGGVSRVHTSTMGYQGNDSSILEKETAPAIAELYRSEEVDLVLLAPV